MTLFQFKPFSFINCAIKRIVKYIKSNAKKYCFFVNLTNATFWKNTPRGQEILEFFKGMTHSQTIEFLGLFDIFVVGFHNGINAFISMTADPSSLNFEKTLWVSISKGYNRFSERCSGRATPSVEIGDDLRSSIGSTPVQSTGFSTSPVSGVQDSSVESDFQQSLSTFGQCSSFQCFETGPATQQFYRQFQGFRGPESEFSLFSAQPPSFGGAFRPIAQGGQLNPFTSQANFIEIEQSDNPLHRKEQGGLKIVKGRVVRVEIPSCCSSGQSTSSTVEKKSPRELTPIATTMSNLEKKISRLERRYPEQGSLDFLELQTLLAKLEKIRNSFQ